MPAALPLLSWSKMTSLRVGTELFFYMLLKDMLHHRFVDSAIGAEESLKVFCPAVQDGHLVRKECLAVSTAQGTHHLVRGATDCLQGFIETPVVTTGHLSSSPAIVGFHQTSLCSLWRTLRLQRTA